MAQHQQSGTNRRPAVRRHNHEGSSPLLLICEHASNEVPEDVDLRVDAEVMSSHAAYDPGAIEVATGLSGRHDAHLISAGFSRLVYDLNRPPSSPDAMRAGFGSLIVAIIAYAAMGWAWLEHLIFTFPELLLVVLALVLLAGRYTGYRLLELSRFKALSGQ